MNAIDIMRATPIANNLSVVMKRDVCSSCFQMADIVRVTPTSQLCAVCQGISAAYPVTSVNIKKKPKPNKVSLIKPVRVKQKKNLDPNAIKTTRIDGQVLFLTERGGQLWCGPALLSGLNPAIKVSHNYGPCGSDNVHPSTATREAFRFIADPANRKKPFLFVMFKGKKTSRATEFISNIDENFLFISGLKGEPDFATDFSKSPPVIDMREVARVMGMPPLGTTKPDEFAKEHGVALSTVYFKQSMDGESNKW